MTGFKDRFGNDLKEGMLVSFRYGFNRPKEKGIIKYHPNYYRWIIDYGDLKFSWLSSKTVLKTIEILEDKIKV